MTGSLTPVSPATASERIEAVFDELGSVAVTFE